MITILKIIASIAGGVLDIILELKRSVNNGCFTAILLLLTFPIYLPALGVFFICVGLADQIKRGTGQGNFYEKNEGLKPFSHYISLGEE